MRKSGVWWHRRASVTEIAVITGDLEIYSLGDSEQFEKNQIPCFIDYKKNILSNPMVELIRAALEVLQSGFL